MLMFALISIYVHLHASVFLDFFANIFKTLSSSKGMLKNLNMIYQFNNLILQLQCCFFRDFLCRAGKAQWKSSQWVQGSFLCVWSLLRAFSEKRDCAYSAAFPQVFCAADYSHVGHIAENVELLNPSFFYRAF